MFGLGQVHEHMWSTGTCPCLCFLPMLLRLHVLSWTLRHRVLPKEPLTLEDYELMVPHSLVNYRKPSMTHMSSPAGLPPQELVCEHKDISGSLYLCMGNLRMTP